MSSFATKRKARVIKVDEFEDNAPQDSSAPESKGDVAAEALRSAFKTSSKPFRQSALRKSINADDEDVARPIQVDSRLPRLGDEQERPSQPVVVRPAIGRSGSTKQKKRPSSSRLSFGGDSGSPGGGEDAAAKKAPLAQRALESRTFGGSSKRLPMRATSNEHDHPVYSWEYLQELQSSTPNTPRDLSTLHITGDDEMVLDASELEDALIVNEDEAVQDSIPRIFNDAQIKERKERRARLAEEEQGFISLDEDDARRSKNDDTRLVREDEDLGEGFDEFVEDGGLSLGSKAERDARRRQRREIAELISRAEDGSSENDSDLERHQAFESAQARAGMDGLERPAPRKISAVAAIKPRMPPTKSLKELSKNLDVYLETEEQALTESRQLFEKLRVELDGIQSGQQPEELRKNLKAKERQVADKAAELQRLLAESDVSTAKRTERGLDNFGTQSSDSSDSGG